MEWTTVGMESYVVVSSFEQGAVSVLWGMGLFQWPS